MEKALDRLLRSVPINMQTALVISKGVRFEPIKKIVQPHWRSIPVCKPYRGPASQDLSGTRFGRFTVSCYYRAGTNGSIWLVRCACGDYETRYTKSIKNPNNAGDRCEKCRQVLYLRQRQLRDGYGNIPIRGISDFE